MSIASHRESLEPDSSRYDVVFVGTGISNTFTLVELLAGLEVQKARFARVLLIDKDPDLFTGVPYGTRSGDVGLIISRLADFLPAAHAEPFAAWLAENRERAFERFFAVGGEFVETWRSQFWHDVQAGALAELYLPRNVLGQYFDHIARRAIARAHELGIASCDTAVGEVVDIVRDDDDAFVVVSRDRDGREARIAAVRVVLGLGSAPSKHTLESLLGAGTTHPGCVLIDDPFDPGIATMLERLRTAAKDSLGRDRRVVIVGSNAGALDVIFNLMNDPAIKAAVGRIDVVSTGGKFPEPFTTHPAGFRSAFVCHALNELATRDVILADDIFDAVKSDIDRARGEGLTITDTFWDISVSFNALLDRLSPSEKLRFASETGTRIGTLQRRVGRDYWDVVDRLMRDGTLVVTRGTFPGADLGWEQDDLLAIVNCAGSARLSSRQLHSPLIRTLLERESLRPTGSDLGIEVSDDLETGTPGLYVIGPMLTGNVLHGGAAWNLEHCGRIASFARRLATHLVDRAFAGSPR